MLKKSRSYLSLRNLLKSQKDILDVVLFGSAVKGKFKPKDIDVCIIFRGKVNKELFDKLRLNKEYSHIHFSALTADNFFRKPHNLIRTLLLEGKSLITGKDVSRIFGLRAYAIYTYELSGMNNSKKVRFVYTLKGRGKENGVIGQMGGEFIAPGSFLILIEKDEEVREIMDKWGVKYSKKQILLMS